MCVASSIALMTTPTTGTAGSEIAAATSSAAERLPWPADRPCGTPARPETPRRGRPSPSPSCRCGSRHRTTRARNSGHRRQRSHRRKPMLGRGRYPFNEPRAPDLAGEVDRDCTAHPVQDHQQHATLGLPRVDDCTKNVLDPEARPRSASERSTAESPGACSRLIAPTAPGAHALDQPAVRGAHLWGRRNHSTSTPRAASTQAPSSRCCWRSPREGVCAPPLWPASGRVARPSSVRGHVRERCFAVVEHRGNVSSTPEPASSACPRYSKPAVNPGRKSSTARRRPASPGCRAAAPRPDRARRPAGPQGRLPSTGAAPRTPRRPRSPVPAAA